MHTFCINTAYHEIHIISTEVVSYFPKNIQYFECTWISLLLMEVSCAVHCIIMASPLRHPFSDTKRPEPTAAGTEISTISGLQLPLMVKWSTPIVALPPPFQFQLHKQTSVDSRDPRFSGFLFSMPSREFNQLM